MIGGATLARGQVEVGLNDREAILGMRRTEAQFKRSMNRMDGQRATAHIRAETKQLKKDLKEAEQAVKSWDQKVAAIKKKQAGIDKESNNTFVVAQRKQLESDRKSAQARLNAARKIANAKRGELAVQEDINDEIQKTIENSEYIARLEDAHLKRGQAQLKNKKAQAKAARETVTEVERHESQVTRLQVAYRKAAVEAEKLNRESRKARTILSPGAQQRVRLDRDAALADMMKLRAELQVLGQDPVDLEIDVRGENVLAKWARAISTTTVRIGPFTATIGKLTRAIAVIGPAIMGVIGWLGALTGPLAGATAGVLGLAGALGVGFVGAAAGIFGIVKPLVGDFMDIKKATDAAADAARKYGKGSDEHKKKLEQLKNTMKDVPASARDQYKALGGLNERWKSLTRASRPRFFAMMGEGIRTVSDMMPMFARRSNESFKTVSAGLNTWMRELRSPQGQIVVDEIFGNFNKSIPALMNGLGNLAAASGKFFAAFSRHLPGTMGTFDTWASGLNRAASDTDRMRGRADSLMDSLRGVGRLFSSTGRVLYQFFRAGMGPGTDSLNTMSDSLDSLARRMSTVSGQRDLRNFFEESISTAERLYGALKPILQLFMEWVTILRPFTDQALAVVGFLGKIVAALADFGPSRALMQAAFGIFIAGKLANSVRSVATAFRGLRASILALGGAQAGAALLGAAATARGTAAAAAGAGGLAAAGAAGSRYVQPVGFAASKAPPAPPVTAWSKAGRALNGASVAMLGMRAATAGYVGVAAAAAYGIYKLTTKTTELEAAQKHAAETQQAAASSFDAMPQLHDDTVRGVYAMKQANSYVQDLQKQLKGLTKGSREYKRVQDEIRMAKFDRSETRQGVLDTMSATLKARTDAVSKHRASMLAAKKDADDLASKLENADPMFHDEIEEKYGSLEDARKRQAAAQRELTVAEQKATLASVNQSRALSLLPPLADSAAKAFHRLSQTAGGQEISQKIALKYEDPRKAETVGRAASAALKRGAGKRQVMNIIANTRNVDLAVARLRAVRIPSKIVRIVENGGPEAIRMLRNIAGRKLTKKEFKIAQEGGAPALDLLVRLHRQRVENKQFTVRAIDSASGVIGGILGALSNIAGKVFEFIVKGVRTGASVPSGPADGGYMLADGGRATPNAKRVGAGIAHAARRKPQRTNGGVLSRPTFVVGEENRPEYVIATNPAYRKRNVGLLSHAAERFGYTLSNPVQSAAGGNVTPDLPKHRTRGKNRVKWAGRKPWEKPGKGKRGERSSFDERFYRAGGASLEDLQAQRDRAQRKYDAWTNWKANKPTAPHSSASDKAKANHKGDMKKWRKNMPDGTTEKKPGNLKNILNRWNKYLKMAGTWQGQLTKWETTAEAWSSMMSDPKVTPKNFTKYKKYRDAALKRMIAMYERAYNFARQHPGHKHRNKPDSTWEATLLSGLGRSRTELAENEKATHPALGAQIGPTQADVFASETYAVLRDYMGNVALGGVAGDAVAAPAALADMPGGNTPGVPAGGKPDIPKGGSPRLATGFKKPTTAAEKAQARRKESRRTPAQKKLGVRWKFKGGKGAWVRGKYITDKHGTALMGSAPGSAAISARIAGDAVTGAARSTSAAPGGGAGTVVNKTVNQTNNYQAPPPDPHTFSQGTLYELQAA